MLSVRQPNPPPDPGQYDGVDPKVYHSWAAYNASALKEGARTAAHLMAYLNSQDPSPTPAKRLGSAIHTACLEPEKFAERYVARPDSIDRKTAAGKAAWADLCVRYGEERILDADDYQTVLACQRALWEDADCRALLTAPGKSEPSIVWKDEETGLLCKMRPDRLIDQIGTAKPIILDVKSTDDASVHEFERSIANFGYHISAAVYIDGYRARFGTDADFVIAAAENSAPHGVALWVMHQDWIDLGRRIYRRALTTAAAGERTGMWPGYPKGPRVITCPPWLLMREQELDEVRAGAA